MKLKEESKVVENMLLNVPSVPTTTLDPVPFELEDPEPVFTVNYGKEMKNALRKARSSIKLMLKSSIPSHYLDDDYIKDKIEQDAESLGKLYYQQKIIELVEQANVDAIGSGNISARLIEVFNQTAKALSDISDQINKMQTALRKSYIDLVLDLKYKAQEEEQLALGIGSGNGTPKMIVNKDEGEKNVFVGTKEVTKKLMLEKKRKNRPEGFVEIEEVE